MIKGVWGGITNCEKCIYDRSCGTSYCCWKPSETDDSEQSNLASQEQLDTRPDHELSTTLVQNCDILHSPDPTSPVVIVQVPEVPRFAEHFPDDDLNYTQ